MLAMGHHRNIFFLIILVAIYDRFGKAVVFIHPFQ